ncbi:P-selectin-like, partial [Ruditapes philippinarum]|uniref:P-selectin-like n=1 Tax=Ruditapes philippinarum TaxID=129788 RepID=UPI00295A8FC7
CGKPPEQRNGYLNTTVNGTEIGAFATLECYDGYRASYGSQPVCDNTAHWEVFVWCKPVECGEVEAPTNGTMNVSGLTFGNNVTFQCEEGYEIKGTDMIRCVSTGSWSASVPTCIEDNYDAVDKDKVSNSNKPSWSIVGLVLAISLPSFTSSVRCK